MNKLFAKLFFSSLLLFSCVFPSYAYVDRDTAVVSVMDKAAGKTQTFSVSLNEEVRFDNKLSLVVRSCKQTDPFQAQDFYMFVEIKDTDKLIFSGWMSHNIPSLNPLQNPDYDVWLVKCE